MPAAAPALRLVPPFDDDDDDVPVFVPAVGCPAAPVDAPMFLESAIVGVV